jgi:hypothetical protein
MHRASRDKSGLLFATAGFRSIRRNNSGCQRALFARTRKNKVGARWPSWSSLSCSAPLLDENA